MLEALYDENELKILEQIWQVIFMLIMHDEMIEKSLARRRMFSTHRRVIEEDNIED
jgi:hypothetical protein